MLQILYACYKQLDESFLTNQSKRVSKQKRIENILLNSIVPISKEDILRKVPDISVTTVERVLGNMLHEGAITKIGTTRGARYKKA
jgi:Fe2+ or Zn2+ uptake regulation protein